MAELNPQLREFPFDGPRGRPIKYINPAGFQSRRQAGHDGEELALIDALDWLTGPDGQLRPEEILVLTCRGQEKSRWYRAEHRTLESHRLRWIGQGERAGHVTLSTIRSAKGLEFKVVVLAELDGIERDARHDALLYIAISRARHHLVVLGLPAALKPRATGGRRSVFGTRGGRWRREQTG